MPNDPKPPRPRPAHADDLSETLAEAQRLLARGVADRRSPWHTPTLASIGLDGAASLRTVVLRGFDAAARSLRIHTDARSAKLAELARDPRCAVHIYDPGQQIQLRLAGTARVHVDDALAAAHWAASVPNSRMIYAAFPAPGVEVPAPPPGPTDPDGGEDNFAVIMVQFNVLEWLWLAHDGHRRARFAWDADGLTARWLAP